jgi:hypothetical protein
MFQDSTPRRRWPRSQLFSLSAKGGDAEAQYRSSIIASRAQEGRSSFDAARSAWAQTFQVQPDDGLYLGEARGGPIKLEQLVTALESCGKTRKDALAAVERLLDAGLLSMESAS